MSQAIKIPTANPPLLQRELIMPRQRKPIDPRPAKTWDVCASDGRPVHIFGCFQQSEARAAAAEIGGFVRPVTPALVARRGVTKVAIRLSAPELYRAATRFLRRAA